MTKFSVLIPARAGSTRLPNKPLLEIAGKPMIGHVIETAKKSGAENVIVATDDQRIKKVSEGYGAFSVITDSKHPSGSDRIAEAAETLKIADNHIVVNLQGDEPLMPSSIITKIAELKYDFPDISVTTAATRIKNKSELDNSNSVKVILNCHSEAIYFSRSIIPFKRDIIDITEAISKDKNDQDSGFSYLRHLGIYSFKIGDIKKFVSWGPCELENYEKLEQLRWLWNKKTIKVTIVDELTPQGVDTLEDLEIIRNKLQK